MALPKYLSSDILFEAYDQISCDRASIPQEKLDLTNKLRSSLLLWRGQFSPELVEIFLNTYGDRESVVLDPFVGSGTTLFESARKDMECYGAEINPSAMEMASTAHMVSLDDKSRKEIIQSAEAIIRSTVRPSQLDLFNYLDYVSEQSLWSEVEVMRAFPQLLAKAQDQPFVHNLLVNTIIRYMGSKQKSGTEGFLRAFKEHSKLVENLPYSQRTCRVFHADARSIDLPDACIDLVITSPPYINVFNYHQNNRQAMELVGWDILHIAKSELGANRKNRQNRFLTVIQYALDMASVLVTIHRLLQINGRAIVVVGRESKVRGISFKNGRLVAALATTGVGFSMPTRQERKFKNKFGEVIYEDILHLIPKERPLSIISAELETVARSIAKTALMVALEVAPNEIRNEIVDALERAETVKQSPVFQPYFAQRQREQ